MFMANYQCLNSKCENSKHPVSVQCEGDSSTCPQCGAAMLREDLIKK